MLWFCVLEETIRCLKGGPTATASSRARLRAEAITWLDSEETYPGSFRWICDTLDIEPDYLRQRIAEGITLRRRSPACGNAHPTVARARRNGV